MSAVPVSQTATVRRVRCDHFELLYWIASSDGYFRLLDAWIGFGSHPDKVPEQYLKSPEGRGAILATANELDVDVRDLFNDRSEGTYVHRLLLVAYARWIDPGFGARVDRVAIQAVENAQKKIDRKNPQWIEAREIGKQQTKVLNSVVSDRVDGPDHKFAVIASEGDLGLFGKKTADLKVERGISKNSSSRNFLTEPELRAKALQESLAAERIAEQQRCPMKTAARINRSIGHDIRVVLVKHNQLSA